MVERFCDEALWLDHGEKKGMGDPADCRAYVTAVEVSEEEQPRPAMRGRRSRRRSSPDEPASAVLPDHPVESAVAPSNMFQAAEGRWGSREVEITDVSCRAATATAGTSFTAALRSTSASACARRCRSKTSWWGSLFNAEGVCCYGTNTNLENYRSERLQGDAEVTFRIDSLDLVEGTYKVDVAVHKLDGYPHDYHRLLYTFRVKSRTKDVGIYRPPHEWYFSDGIKLDEGVERMKASSGARPDGPRSVGRVAAGVRATGRRSSSRTASSTCSIRGTRYLREAASLGMC